MSYTEYEELIRIFLEYKIVSQIKLNKTNVFFFFFFFGCFSLRYTFFLMYLELLVQL